MSECYVHVTNSSQRKILHIAVLLSVSCMEDAEKDESYDDQTGREKDGTKSVDYDSRQHPFSPDLCIVSRPITILLVMSIPLLQKISDVYQHWIRHGARSCQFGFRVLDETLVQNVFRVFPLHVVAGKRRLFHQFQQRCQPLAENVSYLGHTKQT